MWQRRLFVLLSCIALGTLVHGNYFHLFLKRQNCEECLSKAQCCSKWGFCGSGEEHCGPGCQAGPCTGHEHGKHHHDKSIITETIFRCAFPSLSDELLTRRLQGLRETGWSPANTEEAAVFLSHVSHETDGLRTYVEYCQQTGSCGNYQHSWCAAQPRSDKQYYGRGWFQLSYPCNYWKASEALNVDLLADPDQVAQSDRIAAATAIWYYTTTGMSEPGARGDFAATTRILNKHECKDNAGHHLQQARVNTYQRIRQCFGLDQTTDKLFC